MRERERKREREKITRWVDSQPYKGFVPWFFTKNFKQNERRSTSVDSRMSVDGSDLSSSTSSNLYDTIESLVSSKKTLKRQITIDPIIGDFDPGGL